jgi:hypothetical protein
MIKFSQICSVFKPSQTLKIRPPALRDIERYWEFVTLGVAAVFAASNASSAVAATQDLVQRFVARRKLRLSRTTAPRPQLIQARRHTLPLLCPETAQKQWDIFVQT